MQLWSYLFTREVRKIALFRS